MGTITNIISGIIINKTTIPNKDIFIDVIHPKNNEWYYPNISKVEKLPDDGKFVFRNVKPGRVTFLRVYTKKNFKFFDKLKLIWRHWFRNFKYVNLKRWNDIGTILGFRPYCFDYEIYYVMPILNYKNDIKIEIFPENTQNYFPSWTAYIGEFAYEHEINETNLVKDVISKLLLSHYKELNAEQILDFELYKKKYGNEVYCIGSRWKNDNNIIIMPLTYAVD